MRLNSGTRLRWTHLGKSTAPAPCVYTYKGNVCDVTELSNLHPSGAPIRRDHHGKDVTQVFHDEYNLHAYTKSALNMLLQCLVGSVR